MRRGRDDSESDITVVPEYRPNTVNTQRINTAPTIIPDIRSQQRARINTPRINPAPPIIRDIRPQQNVMTNTPRIDPAPLIIPDIQPEQNVLTNTPRPARTNPVRRPRLDETAANAKSAIMLDIVYQLILAIEYFLLIIQFRIVGIPATICVIMTAYSACVLCNFNAAKDDASRRRITLVYGKFRNQIMTWCYTSKLVLSYLISLIVFLFTSNVIPGLWMASLGIDIKSGKYEKYSNLIDIVTILFMLLPIILVVYQMFAKAKVATMNQVNIEGFDR
jgi:hypothetical protein